MLQYEIDVLNELNKLIESNYKGKRLNALNIGCGHQILKQNEKIDWTNLDMYKNIGIDIVHDLNIYPYPFKNNTFDIVFCNMVLEHLDRKDKPIEEIYRITKKDGVIFVIVPYYNHKGALTHLDHKQFFDEGTYNRYNGESHRDLHASKTDARFEINYNLICIGRFRKYLPFKHLFNIFLHNIYSEIWFELKVLK